MIPHSISCDYPEGCSCGASSWNELEAERNSRVRENEYLKNEISKIIEKPDYTNPKLMVRRLKEILEGI